jgi:hypothetical protein
VPQPLLSAEDHAKGYLAYQYDERVVRVGIKAYLAAVRGPISLVVEGLGVPYCLEQDLWETNGVGRWAPSAGLKGTCLRIRDMLAMIRRI